MPHLTRRQILDLYPPVDRWNRTFGYIRTFNPWQNFGFLTDKLENCRVKDPLPQDVFFHRLEFKPDLAGVGLWPETVVGFRIVTQPTGRFRAVDCVILARPGPKPCKAGTGP